VIRECAVNVLALKERSMMAWRIVAGLAALLLVAAIVWASAAGAILDEGSAMLAMPWGLVTFIDLYGSFLFAATVILLMEPSRPAGVILALLVFVLGSVVTLGWAVWRAPMLWRRLTGVRPPGV
jgi:hypothetical protein